MNEVDLRDKTDLAAKPPMVTTMPVLGIFHFNCCGIPVLLLSGVSLASIFPSWPAIGSGTAALGIVGFIWNLRKGCATCPGNGQQCTKRIR